MPPKLDLPGQTPASRVAAEQRVMARDVLTLPSPPVPATSSPVPPPNPLTAPDKAAAANDDSTPTPRRSTLDAVRPAHSDSPPITTGNPSLLRKGTGLTLSEATQRVKPAGSRARICKACGITFDAHLAVASRIGRSDDEVASELERAK